jgi:hypothetical protein
MNIPYDELSAEAQRRRSRETGIRQTTEAMEQKIRALGMDAVASVAWWPMLDTRRNEAAASVRDFAVLKAQQLDLSAEELLAAALKAERKRVKNKA